MHIVWTILLGLAAGIIAKLIFPGQRKYGLDHDHFAGHRRLIFIHISGPVS
jgi:uncharacterized membrane protein YeaQ/YmgE (transglycosylase-associated protein family)